MAKEWKNHKGETVPEKYVSDYDKKKERVILKIAKDAEKINKQLLGFKKLIFGESDKLFDDMFKAHNMEKKPGKGNYTLYTFDKSMKIEVNVQDNVDFDDRIQLAQEKLNQFIELKTKDVDMDLSVLINNAFKTNKGRLDKSRIFGLFQLKINHPMWLEAIELIKQSVVTNDTSRYATVSKRTADGRYVLVQLNFSKI